MGWEDEWTRFKAVARRGKKSLRGTVRSYERDGATWDVVEQADGPRYRQCGNGVVKTLARWLAVRVREYGFAEAAS